MATKRWLSSLSDIETRVRRSLGIAGPIDLALGAPPTLTPVQIADDATRPGTSASLRNRRWMGTAGTGSITVGNRGSIWLFADSPPGAIGFSDRTKGGIIVDRMTFSHRCQTVPAGGLRYVMNAFPYDLVTNAPGIPIAVTPDNVRYVDPTMTTIEVAMIALYGSATVPPEAGGGGPQIHRFALPSGAAIHQQELEIFLPWNTALVVGIDPVTAVTSNTDLDCTFAGRVF